jgi:autotransporter-associated beta strand protein
VSGASTLANSITTSGTQTYTGAVTLGADTTLTSTNSQISFGSNITGSGKDLTISSGSGAITVGVIGTSAAKLGDLTFNSSGVTTLGGAVYANSIQTDSSGTGAGTLVINGGSVTTTGIQTYREAVTLGADTTLSTTDSQITFSDILNSKDSEVRTLTMNVGTSEVEFNGIVGGTSNGSLGAIAITGNLDLNANIANAASLSVSGTSNLGANVTTSGAQTYDGDIVLSSNVTLSVGGSSTASGVISGAFNFVKAGSGTLALTAANTYSGSTHINAGTLNVTGTLNNATAVTVASGATYIVATDDTVASLAGEGLVNLNAALTINGSSDTTYSGVMSGAGSLIKNGSSIFTLSGANTYTGATKVFGGTLLILSDNNLGTAPSTPTPAHLVIQDGATLRLATGGASNFITIHANRGIQLNNANGGVIEVMSGIEATYGGVIAGTGPFVKSGAGQLNFAGQNNTYSGGTTIQAGYLMGGAGTMTATIFGSGTLTIDSGATVQIDRVEINNNIILNGGKLIASNGFGEILNGSITLSANSEIDSIYSLTLNGSISGSGKLILNNTWRDEGVLRIGGSATHTGGTELVAGILQIGNGSTSGSLLGNITSSNRSQVWFDRSDEASYSGLISGSGSLTKSGSGRLTLTANNTFSGITTINSGILRLGSGSSAGNVGAGAIINNGQLAVDRSTDLSLSNAISGTGSLNKLGANSLTLTGLATYTGSTAVAGTLIFKNDAAPLTVGFTGNGALVIEPSSTSFTSSLATSYTYGSSLTSLTLGKAGNASHITIGSTTFINGPIRIYADDISINHQVTASNDSLYLFASGDVTQAASVIAQSLALQGTGNFNLNNVNNSISVIAAGDTNNRIGNLFVSNSQALTVDTVNPTGIYSSGTVHLETISGNLTISQNISTTDTSENAVFINAGKSAAAGVTTGGNIIISGGATISTGTNGRITLMTGSIDDSTGVTSLVGSGSGKFRYNSDESVTSYSAALGVGAHAIYREKPVLTIKADDKNIIYGNAVTFTSTVSSYKNGDTLVQSIVNPATVTTPATITSSGFYVAGTHTLIPSSASSSLGYDFSYVTGDLAITPRAITLTADNRTKVYGDNLSLGSTGFARTSGTFATGELATAVTLTSVNGFAASATQVVNSGYANEIVPSLATGTGGFLASNYDITYVAASLGITQKALSITANNQTTTYGTSRNLGNTSFSSTGLINGDSISSVTLKQNGNQITPALQDAGTYEGSINGIIASLATGSGLSNYAITYVPGRLTINSLNTVTWTGLSGDNNWSTAANWTNNAVPLRSNVNNVVIPAGFTVNFDSVAADNANKPSSEINNRSNLVFNLNTNFDFSNTLSGSGSIRQQGSGILTISGRNTDYTGNTFIGSSQLHLTNAAALGTGALVSNGGQLSMASNITLPSLRVIGDANNSGQVSLASSIYTFGAQNYTGNVVITGNGNTRLEAINSNILFGGTITAGSNSKGNLRSLLINAGTGTVTFNDRVGSDRGLYANFNARDTNLYTLSVRAARIEINADIMTFENQIYTGAVIIGNNGTNGLVRTLISVDPSIVFDGTIDDSVLNTHTLHALAIAVDNTILPTLEFKGNIGGTQALASFDAVVGTQLTTGGSQVGDIGSNPATFNGTISIAGNVTTAGNQSYTADNIVLGAPGSNQLQKFTTTDNGNVNFNVGLGPNAISINNDSSSYGLLFDLGRGSLSAAAESALAASGISYDQITPPSNLLNLLTDIKNQFRNKSTDVADDDVIADVSVGGMEDAGDSVKCDVALDEDCAVTL